MTMESLLSQKVTQMYADTIFMTFRMMVPKVLFASYSSSVSGAVLSSGFTCSPCGLPLGSLVCQQGQNVCVHSYKKGGGVSFGFFTDPRGSVRDPFPKTFEKMESIVVTNPNSQKAPWPSTWPSGTTIPTTHTPTLTVTQLQVCSVSFTLTLT